MNLYQIILNHVSDKLKFKKEINYVNVLLNNISFLNELKKNNLKNLIDIKFLNDINNNNSIKEDFLITYIINISFLKTNTIVNISDIKGNTKLFYTAGNVNLSGKQKKRRKIALLRLINLIFKKAGFIEKKPVALHLNNVVSYKTLIINKLKQVYFIKLIKSYNQIPYNGCRKKKIRRKKYSKLPK